MLFKVVGSHSNKKTKKTKTPWPCSHNHSPAVPIITVQRSPLACYTVAYSKLIITFECVLFWMKTRRTGRDWESGRHLNFALRSWQGTPLLVRFWIPGGASGQRSGQSYLLSKATSRELASYMNTNQIQREESRAIYSIVSISEPFWRLFWSQCAIGKFRYSASG